MTMTARVLIASSLLLALAHGKPWPWWPESECTNGWVDGMTGMCPPVSARRKPAGERSVGSRWVGSGRPVKAHGRPSLARP